jgi:hypothetical protein
MYTRVETREQAGEDAPPIASGEVWFVADRGRDYLG